MKDLAELVEKNRFVGREFLLWLWFESELGETNLTPSSAHPCSLWFETQITLSGETGEARIKSPSAAASKEAKTALTQGKLPIAAKLQWIIEEHEFSCGFKADELAISALKVPAVLKADEDAYEALYERMRLVELFYTTFTALFGDFLAMRLAPSWEGAVRKQMCQWARGKPVDESSYLREKAIALKRRTEGKRASRSQ